MLVKPEFPQEATIPQAMDYVVMTNYGIEGWKIQIGTDDLQEAIDHREMCHAQGVGETEIFQPLRFIVDPKSLALGGQK